MGIHPDQTTYIASWQYVQSQDSKSELSPWSSREPSAYTRELFWSRLGKSVGAKGIFELNFDVQTFIVFCIYLEPQNLQVVFLVARGWRGSVSTLASAINTLKYR